MTPPHERLDAWLKTHNITQATFAERINVSQSFVSRLCDAKAEMKPSVEIAQAIDRETDGDIGWTDWFPMAKGRTPRARAGT